MDDFIKKTLRFGSKLDQVDAELREIQKRLKDPRISADEAVELEARCAELSEAVEAANIRLESARKLIEGDHDA